MSGEPTTPTTEAGAFARHCYNASVTGGVSPAWARRMLSDAAAVIDSLYAELAEARTEPADRALPLPPCTDCGHLVGTHTADQETDCRAPGCPCPAYRTEPAEPDTWGLVVFTDDHEVCDQLLDDARKVIESEHGHKGSDHAPWPSCLPVHMVLNRITDALGSDS